MAAAEFCCCMACIFLLLSMCYCNGCCSIRLLLLFSVLFVLLNCVVAATGLLQVGCPQCFKLLSKMSKALCHTGIPIGENKSDKVKYEAESLEEVAFLIASQEFGFKFCRRSPSVMVVKELDPSSGSEVEREYDELLNLLELSSSGKRMSVIVRNEDGQSLSYAKKMGFGQWLLEETEYQEWNTMFSKAKETMGPQRDELLEGASEMIENDLILLGVLQLKTSYKRGSVFPLPMRAMKVEILHQIQDSYQMICDEFHKDVPFALVIDGKVLEIALGSDMKDQFSYSRQLIALLSYVAAYPQSRKLLYDKSIQLQLAFVTVSMNFGGKDISLD
ncbi:hypothetical protein C3L33_06603, partial [Rhododendron williamsianum]